MQLDSEIAGRAVFVGRATGDHVVIRVLGRTHNAVDDYWDGNWLASEVAVVAGGFRGSVGAALRAEEFQAFRQGLERIHAEMIGSAAFASMEDWLTLDVTVRSRGHLDVRGAVVDRLGDGNELRFTVGGLDLSHLSDTILALAQVEREFPVVGSP